MVWGGTKEKGQVGPWGGSSDKARGGVGAPCGGAWAPPPSRCTCGGPRLTGHLSGPPTVCPGASREPVRYPEQGTSIRSRREGSDGEDSDEAIGRLVDTGTVANCWDLY